MAAVGPAYAVALERFIDGCIIENMKSRAIEKEALELPVARRAKLAQRLLESLEDLSEAEAEKLWLKESARRAAEIDQGKVRLVKSEELERRVRARIR